MPSRGSAQDEGHSLSKLPRFLQGRLNVETMLQVLPSATSATSFKINDLRAFYPLHYPLHIRYILKTPANIGVYNFVSATYLILLVGNGVFEEKFSKSPMIFWKAEKKSRT